jgi:hypothetical protein
LCIAALSLALVGAGPAWARGHGHVLAVQGNGGRAAIQTRSVERQPGAARIDRSLQTSGGHGYQATRDRSSAPGQFDSRRSLETNDGHGGATARSARWGEGSYAGSKQTSLNNGKSYGRTTSASANGDGSADYSTTFTGPDGQSRTVTGTVTGNR